MHLSHLLVMSMYHADTFSPEDETVTQQCHTTAWPSVSETNHRLTINRLTSARVLLVEGLCQSVEPSLRNLTSSWKWRAEGMKCNVLIDKEANFPFNLLSSKMCEAFSSKQMIAIVRKLHRKMVWKLCYLTYDKD